MRERAARVHRAIATHSVAAQRAFDDGLFMLEAFNMGEARLRFRRAATIDPAWAMAWWGVALAACELRGRDARHRPTCGRRSGRDVHRRHGRVPRRARRWRLVAGGLPARSIARSPPLRATSASATCEAALVFRAALVDSPNEPRLFSGLRTALRAGS